MQNFYVYQHIRNDTGECFYIGKGKNNRINSVKGRNEYWKNIVNKVGFHAKLIANNLFEKEALKFETIMIKSAKTIGQCKANILDGGEGCAGYKHTEEHKKKISLIHKGKIVSIETRQKMMGKNNPMFGRNGNKNPMYGIKRFGKISPNFKGQIIATEIKTGKIIKLMGNAEIKSAGFNPGCVCECINNRLKHHKGFTFNRVSKEFL